MTLENGAWKIVFGVGFIRFTRPLGWQNLASRVSLFKAIGKKLEYEIETVSQLTATSVAGIDYGIIEAKWIPTGSLGLPLFGRFSYYHIGLLVLMFVVSSALAWSHIQWLLENKKKYVVLVCAAALPLSLMIEDITWFVVRGQPIRYDEWTMIRPGWGINIGVTWIPSWYLGTITFSVVLLWLANKYAEKGYRAYLAAYQVRRHVNE